MSFDNHRTSAMDGKSSSSSGNQGDTQSQTATASVPIMCRAGCGFYANSAFDGMCSKCFKDLSQQKSTVSTSSSSTTTTTSTAVQTSLPVPTSSPSPSSSTTSSDSLLVPASLQTGLPTVCSNVSLASRDSAIDTTDTESEIGDTSSDTASCCDKPKKKRCTLCKKRVGLTGFDCRCGGHFCSIHRYSDAHNCDFNYHALAQSEIRRHNPVVAAEKVKKI